MSIAYYCVFIAGLLPYFFVILAKAGGQGYRNATPRLYLEQLKGWRQRAHWAQLNAFEAFPFFAVAVLLAHQLAVPQSSLDKFAMIFIAARVLHGIFYILNQSVLRSLAWFIGIACVVSLFIKAF